MIFKIWRNVVLEISHLTVSYNNKPIVIDVSLKVGKHEIVGIVGESGSGKTTILRSIMGLLPQELQIDGGSISFFGDKINNSVIQRIRGSEIGMVFQNPENYLDPIMKIGQQFYECTHLHCGLSRSLSYKKAKNILSEIGITEGDRVLNSYPFELSGGMLQRAAIAIAIANDPKLLLADEPTSALDVATTVKFIDALLSLRQTRGMAVLFVTHNMNIVSRIADKVGVMQNGEVVEWGARDDVLHDPKHLYTKMLISSIPKIRSSAVN
jgi:peptide/nickel transport system ATP-binding protein